MPDVPPTTRQRWPVRSSGAVGLGAVAVVMSISPVVKTVCLANVIKTHRLDKRVGCDLT
jgi:hypothetical protein